MTTDREGHASTVIVVLDIFPEIMREMIANIWPPKMVLMQIKNEKTFLNNLSLKQKKMILKLESEGYKILDISCLYKVIRNFNLLPRPKQGWGHIPHPEDQNEGDDVERMKMHRNDIIHRPKGGLSESERKHFFQESIEIGKRMDKRIGSPSNGFESKIEDIKSYSITRVKYIEALEKCAEYQERLQGTSRTPSFDLYYGNDIKVKAHIKGLRDNGSTPCTLYVKDPDFDVNAVIQRLEEIIEILRKRECNISLEDAEIGSLNVHVIIPNRCFVTKEVLHKEIQSFLQHFFQIAEIGCITRKIYTVVLAVSENFVADKEGAKTNDFDYIEENSLPILKLNVNVKNSAFEDELVLSREVSRFITGMYNVVGRHNVPVNGSAREVLMLTSGKHTISSSEDNQDPQLCLPITKQSDKPSLESSAIVDTILSYEVGKSTLRKSVRELNKEDENQLPIERAKPPTLNTDEWQKHKFYRYGRSKGYSKPQRPLYKPPTSIPKMISRDTKTGSYTSTSMNISSMNIHESLNKSSEQSPRQYQMSSNFSKYNSNDYTNFNRQGIVKKTNMMSYSFLPIIEKQETEPEVQGITRKLSRDQYSPRRDIRKPKYLPSIEKRHDQYTQFLRPEPSADQEGVYAVQFNDKNIMSQADRESDWRHQSKRESPRTDNRYTSKYKNYQDPLSSSKLIADPGSNPVLSRDIKYSKSSLRDFMNSDRVPLQITGESMYTYNKSRSSRHKHHYYSAPVTSKMSYNDTYQEHERPCKSSCVGSVLSRPSSDYIGNTVK